MRSRASWQNCLHGDCKMSLDWEVVKALRLVTSRMSSHQDAVAGNCGVLYCTLAKTKHWALRLAHALACHHDTPELHEGMQK